MTETQIRVLVIKEEMDADPEFKTEMLAYLDLMQEFGAVSPPIYLQEKLDNIEFIVKARMTNTVN